MSIQKFIESMATKRARPHCSRTPSWSSGWMLARKRTSQSCAARRELRLEVGEDVEVGDVRHARVEVVAVLAGPEEGLAARHVLDVVGDRAARLQHLPVLGPKSSPTGPTGRPRRRTTRRGLKWVAAPPSMRSRAPKGVLTASKAMEPTTVRLIAATQPTRAAAPRRIPPPCAPSSRRSSAAPRCCELVDLPDARARRRRGPHPGLARGDELRRHPPAPQRLPRGPAAAAGPGRRGRGRARGHRRSASSRSAAPAATPSTRPRPRR